MPSSIENRHRIRRSFGNLSAPIKVPHLLKVQLDSFERFLQREVPPDQREDKGLEAVFRSVFPVSDFSAWQASQLALRLSKESPPPVE